MSKEEKIIMGIDPGTNKMGYGLLRVSGKKPECLATGYIDMTKFRDPYTKLRHIYERMIGLMNAYHPDEVAFEAPFFGENVQSMLKLGRAQGVAIAAALSRNVQVHEYAPRKIKIAITGNGNASKVQVARMLEKILSLDELPDNLDATDGLAVALCHYYQSVNPIARSGASSWETFLKKNPERLVAKTSTLKAKK